MADQHAPDEQAADDAQSQPESGAIAMPAAGADSDADEQADSADSADSADTANPPGDEPADQT